MFYNRNKEYSVEYLLLAITICLQFYRLGIGEIQPWDEALYCVRANICLQFGSWIDQTQYAVGGLYSSTHPPLGVWGIALGKYLLGDATYAPRVFAVVCSLVSLIYVYKLAKLLTSRETALISTIVFGNAQIWLWYAHHAQLDVPMHTAVVACLYYTVRSMEGNRSSTILAGVFFGAALLLKAFQAIYILPLLLLLSYILVNTNRLKRISTIITVAFIISLPWYIMMAIQHQEFFSEWMGLFSSLASGTYRVTTGNWWYYLNQVIVNYPFSLLLPFVIYSLRNLFLTKRRFSTQDKMLIVSILYFILMLVFVSVLRTNMPHFILFMSIPVMICTIFSINEVLNTTKSTPLLLSFFAVLIGVCWGGSEQIRMYVKGNESFTFLYNTTNLIIVGTAYLLVAYLIIRRAKYVSLSLLLLVSTVVFGNVYRWSGKENAVFVDGAESVSTIISQSSADTILLIHSDVAHENLLPQFAYYSHGLNLGWDADKKVQTSTFNTVYHNVNLYSMLSYDAVVLYKGWDKYHTPTQLVAKVLEWTDSVLLFNNYTKTITRQYLLYVR